MELLTPNISLIVVTILSLLLIAAIIRALYALWGREDIKQNTKILWMIFFVLAPVIGIICYILFGGRSDFKMEEEETA